MVMPIGSWTIFVPGINGGYTIFWSPWPLEVLLAQLAETTSI
jgi:hypothetical protein